MPVSAEPLLKVLTKFTISDVLADDGFKCLQLLDLGAQFVALTFHIEGVFEECAARWHWRLTVPIGGLAGIVVDDVP